MGTGAQTNSEKLNVHDASSHILFIGPFFFHWPECGFLDRELCLLRCKTVMIHHLPTPGC